MTWLVGAALAFSITVAGTRGVVQQVGAGLRIQDRPPAPTLALGDPEAFVAPSPRPVADRAVRPEAPAPSTAGGTTASPEGTAVADGDVRRPTPTPQPSWDGASWAFAGDLGGWTTTREESPGVVGDEDVHDGWEPEPAGVRARRLPTAGRSELRSPAVTLPQGLTRLRLVVEAGWDRVPASGDRLDLVLVALDVAAAPGGDGRVAHRVGSIPLPSGPMAVATHAFDVSLDDLALRGGDRVEVLVVAAYARPTADASCFSREFRGGPCDTGAVVARVRVATP